MNLRVACLGLALLSLAATGDPCTGDDSGSTGTSMPAGKNGAVCDITVSIECCGSVSDPCSDNNDCCTGNCSAANGGDAAFTVDAGSVCGEPINQGCSVGLSSRCNTGACQCASDNDCCSGSCQAATITGTTGLRCCLMTGNPCDVNEDCCSLTCGDYGQCL
jgi:hypothetical protein